MEFNDVLYSRRSIRSFTSRKLSAAEITELVDAAIQAPSACNMQSWHFYAVTDTEKKDKFKAVCSEWATTAPVLFVVCTDGETIVSRFGDRAKNLFILQDTAAALENLLLKAVDMGLGGCWMGAFNERECRRILDIPDKYNVAAIVPVGEPAFKPPKRDRKPLADVLTMVGEAAVESSDKHTDDKKEPMTIRGVSAPNAIFNDVNFSHALFDNINLDHAEFSNVNMEGVRFGDINMTKTFFGGLNLSQSFFGCVDFIEAQFESPRFDNAVFKGCSMKNVTFEDCDMEGAVIKPKGKDTEIKL